jgi:hypothetical protein
MTPPYEGDLDAVLENVPHTERPRALVDHYDAIAQRLIVEAKRGVITKAELLERLDLL